MTIFQQGRLNFRQRTKAARGRPVTYRRGRESCQLTAVPGELGTNYFDPGSPVNPQARLIVWLVVPGEIVFNGAPTEPQVGDELAETIDGQELTYRLAPRDGEPAWRYSDGQNTFYTCHCILITKGTTP